VRYYISRRQFRYNDLTMVGENRVKLIWALEPYIFRRFIRVYSPPPLLTESINSMQYYYLT